MFEPVQHAVQPASGQSASGFLHRNLKDRLNLRHIPHLEFILDRSLARGDRIMRLMRTIEEEREHRGP